MLPFQRWQSAVPCSPLRRAPGLRDGRAYWLSPSALRSRGLATDSTRPSALVGNEEMPEAAGTPSLAYASGAVGTQNRFSAATENFPVEKFETGTPPARSS